VPAHKTHDPSADTATLPKLELAPYVPPSAQELARRKRLIDEARRLRDESEPLDIPTDDLIHLARAEAGR
jgi:hypothetical protein